MSEDADIGDVVGVFKATSLYTPSDIVYRLKPPVKVLDKDNSEHIVPDDMFRLESTSAGAVIYINQLNEEYNLQDATRYSFHVVAVDQARTNASTTAVVEVAMFMIVMLMIIGADFWFLVGQGKVAIKFWTLIGMSPKWATRMTCLQK